MHWVFSYLLGISWKLFSYNPLNMAKDFREQHLLRNTVSFLILLMTRLDQQLVSILAQITCESPNCQDSEIPLKDLKHFGIYQSHERGCNRRQH